MWRVTTVWTGLSIVGGGVTRFYFNDTSGSAQQAATAVATLWTGIESRLSDQAQWLVEPEVDTLNPATGAITAQTSVTGDNGAGTDITDRLPPANQMLIRLRTGVFVGGREIRGRFFIPGQMEQNSINGVPQDATCDLVQGVVNGYIADVDTQPVVWSRTQGLFQPISSATVWRQQWAVLRSRRD